MNKLHAVFDTEIIGWYNPVFLVCVKIVETQEVFAFWHHRRDDRRKLIKLMDRDDLIWVSFNGIKFDLPLIAAWIKQRDTFEIKAIATRIIHEKAMPWELYNELGIQGIPIDHIDLIDVAPGVMISLKTYAGRMHYPTMVDLPFHYDEDLTRAQYKVLEKYCMNDLGVTEALFKNLSEQLALREHLGEEYEIDLRSKSDAQIAEAILKKKTRIGKSTNRPSSVTYKAPSLIKTKNSAVQGLIDQFENQEFEIDFRNGSPIEPEWMNEPFEFRGGLYKVGLGGLHSQHDTCVYHEADDEWMISDIDAASYYPTIILKCGLVPEMSGNKGEAFLEAYSDIYKRRLEAKRNGDKVASNTLKILLNGMFGKLGSIYCPFYSPDLLLAVTITGQLNLLTLIDDLAKQRGIEVISANTDGIMVKYKTSMRAKMLSTVAAHGKRTGFEYEETRYLKVAIKDVNSYLAIKLDGSVKAKGLYASAGVLEMKNPTAEVCSQAAITYLKSGIGPEVFVYGEQDFKQFLSIRTVNGGGVQHTKERLVDDWIEVAPGEWTTPRSNKATTKRKSRPPPRKEFYGGVSFGRVARWYMTTEKLPPITYVSNGNTVAKTEGAKLCMTLPEKIPTDLDRAWYVRESYNMLANMGVKI